MDAPRPKLRRILQILAGRVSSADCPKGEQRVGTPAGETSGRLVCVGLGMMLGAHIGPRTRSYIEQADVVFVAVSDPIVELWVQQMHNDVRSLQPYYAEGKSRHQTYREMVEAMLVEVRGGRGVCGAFYGHPGVFAQVPHAAIARARQEGFPAHMEAAVSAEDCLYADLGIDPGGVGCQHYEASQLLFYRRTIEPSAYLVLWQVGLAGDRTYRRFASGPELRQLLVDRLLVDYPADHEVIVYEAATLPIGQPRMESVRLRDLAAMDLGMHSTLVVPPSRAMERDQALLARIQEIEERYAAT
ncbi:SAM-dependent methyltransferase [Aerolutibacter daejeonensis]|nr:SAM-dependent methyltransferase [Lysobacter daejeonensis]